MDLARKIEAEGGSIPKRANDAGANVVMGSRMVNAAAIMHLQPYVVYENAALSILRTSLELVARGGFIALGTGCEATRWTAGPDLPTSQQRKAAQSMFNTAACCARIWPVLQSKNPAAWNPYSVYHWLCSFAHFDTLAHQLNNSACGSRLTHDDAYAALAYVAWVCAAVAEVVTGFNNIAVWPAVWPRRIPW